MVLWIVAGELFGSYLARFAYTYVTYYAGLASVMMALVFLYVTASIFIYGGELNAAITPRKASPGGCRGSRVRPRPPLTGTRTEAGPRMAADN